MACFACTEWDWKLLVHSFITNQFCFSNKLKHIFYCPIVGASLNDQSEPLRIYISLSFVLTKSRWLAYGYMLCWNERVCRPCPQVETYPQSRLALLLGVPSGTTVCMQFWPAKQLFLCRCTLWRLPCGFSSGLHAMLGLGFMYIPMPWIDNSTVLG